MVIDYKDVSFSFKDKKKKLYIKRAKIIAAVALVILLYLAFKSYVEFKKLKNLQTLLLQNKPGQVALLLKESENSFFFPDSKKELSALVYLFNNEISQAQQVLEKLTKKNTRITYRFFLDYFLDNAGYRELRVYNDYLLKKGEDVLFYDILVKTAFFDFKKSREQIRLLPAAERKKKTKELGIVAEMNRELESGKIDYISDLNGNPLACYDTVEKKTISRVQGIDFSPFETDLKNCLKFYKLTIDKKIQEKIHHLFRGYHGSFLLMNLDDGSIIAAYSKPSPPAKGDTVFFEEYEPASIIKVLTLFSYLADNGKDIFPLNCTGSIVLDKKMFYDWKNHGKISSYNEALAVSCNVAFAGMALRVGFKNLSSVFERFYFNGSGLADLFLNFRTGTFNPDIATDFRLAKLAVGLSNNNESHSGKETMVTTTTFHSALVSAFIAQNGSIYTPYLINSIKNVLRVGFYSHKPEIIDTYKDHNRVFLKVKEAMTNVVELPYGTGRRARVDFVKTAVKTGTGGDKKKGYDAILTGFFPAERPRYAFAFILRQAGKAEIQGALFLKNFLLSFYKK